MSKTIARKGDATVNLAVGSGRKRVCACSGVFVFHTYSCTQKYKKARLLAYDGGGWCVCDSVPTSFLGLE